MITFQGNHPEFSTTFNKFLASRASKGGLPQDILLLAYEGYKKDIVSWQFVKERAQVVHDALKEQMPEVILELTVHDSDDVGQAAVGICAYHMSTGVMDNSKEAFFNGASNTFVFWRWGVWLLQTNDQIGATGHFHRRVMTRDKAPRFSFTGLHDAVAALWPALVEVGQRRRAAQEQADLTFFVVPYSSGLICAEFQRLRGSHRFRPILRVLDKEIVTDYPLATPFSNGDDHLLVMTKTFITRLNANQKSLHAMLAAYLEKHSAAMAYLKRGSRLLYN